MSRLFSRQSLALLTAGLTLTTSVACSETGKQSVTSSERTSSAGSESGRAAVQFYGALADSRIDDAKALLASGSAALAGPERVDQILIDLSSSLTSSEAMDIAIVSDETKGDLGLARLAFTDPGNGKRDTMPVVLQREDGTWRVALHLKEADVAHVSPTYQARRDVERHVRQLMATMEGHAANHGRYASNLGDLNYALPGGFSADLTSTGTNGGYTITVSSTTEPTVTCRARVGEMAGPEGDGVTVCD
ncbi:MAG TPA: hypothetical protein VGE02_00085 [Gemmatimonadales bacterium]